MHRNVGNPKEHSAEENPCFELALKYSIELRQLKLADPEDEPR